jgi:hypothetical protein
LGLVLDGCRQFGSLGAVSLLIPADILGTVAHEKAISDQIENQQQGAEDDKTSVLMNDF